LSSKRERRAGGDGRAEPRHGRPVLGFVGIHAGRRTNQPVSQNEILAELFEQSGYKVRRASAIRLPPLRTLHQIVAILTWPTTDLLVVAVFSGRSFWVAELATRLGRLRGNRLVLFLHGGNLPVFGPGHRRWVERVFERADLVLAPSEYLASTFRAWGYDVRVIPNVLAIERYDYSPRDRAAPNLLWMRTFHEHYDPLMAVQVLHRVVQRCPDATLTMGGADHGLLDATRAEVARLGLEDRVTFAGYMLGERKRQAFADHDVFLNTNVVDNMPVSLLEASASGLVPVATAVGGVPAIIRDGDNGVLVDAHDVESMAAAVIGLIEEPDRFRSMSAAARELALRSSWPEVRRRWEEELALVLPQREIGS
jgi:glycosyltransferase involved in cell wall biosynthesis